MGSNQASPKITGKTVEEVRRSAEVAIQQLWAQVNKLIDNTGKSDVGDRNQESGDKGIRLVQTKDEYFIEARFRDGWARLTTSLTPLTKKD